MHPFEIVKPGKHTASNGAVVDFSENVLKGAVAAYDPKLSPAPIVVGHPKDNGPAYGWVGALEFNEDGNLVAKPDQLDPQFSELVKQGRFRTRSASWYLPDSPANPKPGTLYLRHVGFLGAQPPAIKGLKDVSFSEAEGVVEFAETSPYIWSSIAGVFRSLRDYFLAEKGVEVADKMISNYLISDIENEARRQMEKPAPAASFNEKTEQSMTPEQIQAMQAENAKLKADLTAAQANAKPADFAEREAAIAKREQELSRKEVEGQVDALIADGKVTPANKASTVNFAMALDSASATVDFVEGDKVEKLSPRAHYLKQLAAGPKVVEFGERSKPAAGGKDVDEDLSAVQGRIRDQVASGGKATAK